MILRENLNSHLKEREETFAKMVNESFELKRNHENEKNLLRNQNQAQKTLIKEQADLYQQSKESIQNLKSIITNFEEQMKCQKIAVEEETKRYLELKAKHEENEFELILLRRKINCGDLVSKAYIQENEELRYRLKVFQILNLGKRRVY